MIKKQLLLSLALTLFSSPSFAQEEIEHLVVVGSRSVPRVSIDSSVPIDTISEIDIKRTGFTETSQIIQSLIPSFNFSTSIISDGTDSVRPATLRGMHPDQLLVLINGKRRHNSALVHINGSVGRGSAGTDLNAIPPSAIARIEVLRDGASAQYGSDAIAGVINIVLKKDTEDTQASAYIGQTYQNDGEAHQYTFNTGTTLGEDGFLHISAERRSRNPTNRAGPDLRHPQNPFNFRVGQAGSDNNYFFFNLEAPLTETLSLYSFGGISQRLTNGAGFYRLPANKRNRPAIYPDGFLPVIEANIDDHSLSFGLQGLLDEWDSDLSFTYGENEFEFSVYNSLNVSLGDNSPTSANSGRLMFTQQTLNLDLTRILAPTESIALHTAIGAEYREDQFEIKAGEEASWVDGGELDQFGDPGTPGIQVFPGYTPENAVNETRESWALYLDLETDSLPNWLFGVATRYEDYSDFGNHLSGKLSAKYDWSHSLSLRGALSNGFRAPSPMQQYTNNTSTQFVGGVASEVVTARNDSQIAQQLGIPKLKEETSLNLSLGLVFQPFNNLTFLVDAYQIDVDDRVTLSSQYDRPATGDLRTIFGDISKLQFFVNALDTRTRGLDLSVDWEYEFAHGGDLTLGLFANFNEVEITNRIATPDPLSETNIPLVNVRETVWLEDGQPSQNYSLKSYYTYENHDFTLRLKRYGAVRSVEVVDDENIEQEFGARWLTDIEYTNHFTEKFSWTIGANNLFDVRPERNVTDPPGASGNGIFIYNRRVSPFGINGGFYFTRFNFNF